MNCASDHHQSSFFKQNRHIKLLDCSVTMDDLLQNIFNIKSMELQNKANDFLKSKKHANNLADILALFEIESDDYQPVLNTIEEIFTSLLNRGDLSEEIMKARDDSPESQYRKWLQESYENAWALCLRCMKCGKLQSRLQALNTAVKLLRSQGLCPLQTSTNYEFPVGRLKSIFAVLLDPNIVTASLISSFTTFTNYRDVQHYGLQILSNISFKKLPTHTYILNYLELLSSLLANDILKEDKLTDEERFLCHSDAKQPFVYNPSLVRRYTNRCWTSACEWPLCETAATQRRALLLLVEQVLPLMNQPELATDMLADSLDAGGPVSMLALQGILELVRRHNIDYPDIYDRLYAMFEPEIFATRYKKRLMHVTDIFLSSTHLPESMVAAFAKRFSRLALVAPPDDAVDLLKLVANLLHRHPGLKRMRCYENSVVVMSSDPYCMEEQSASSARALDSSLWEVCALRKHWLSTVSRAATVLLHDQWDAAEELVAPDQDLIFDKEMKRHFKSIEMNFHRPRGMSLGDGERVMQAWDLFEYV